MEIGRFLVKYGLSPIHAMLLNLGKPEHRMRLSEAMWGCNCSESMPAFESSRGGRTALVSQRKPVSQAFCIDRLDWMEPTLAMAGMRLVAVSHTQRILDGAACRYEATWLS